MEVLRLEAGAKTPGVLLDPAGVIDMSGRSVPENTAEFYQQVYHWLDRYADTPALETTVNVYFEYFNTSSSKCLLDIFRKLESIHASGKSKVSVQWYFEKDDEDMMETGEDYSSMIKLPFTVQMRVGAD